MGPKEREDWTTQNPGAEAGAISRRGFLVLSASAAGGLLLAGYVGRDRLRARFLGAAADAPTPVPAPSLFIRIEADGTTVIGARGAEIGQGVKTSLPMLIAEELDADWSRVRVEQLPLGLLPNPEPPGVTWKYGPQGAGGSDNIPSAWHDHRQMGAQARWLLVQAAAQRWGAEAAQLSTRAGTVVHADGRTLGYGELAASAAALPLPAAEVPLKHPEDFRIIGTPTRVVRRGGDRHGAHALRDRQRAARRADGGRCALSLSARRPRVLRRERGQGRAWRARRDRAAGAEGRRAAGCEPRARRRRDRRRHLVGAAGSQGIAHRVVARTLRRGILGRARRAVREAAGGHRQARARGRRFRPCACACRVGAGSRVSRPLRLACAARAAERLRPRPGGQGHHPRAGAAAGRRIARRQRDHRHRSPAHRGAHDAHRRRFRTAPHQRLRRRGRAAVEAHRSAHQGGVDARGRYRARLLSALRASPHDCRTRG